MKAVVVALGKIGLPLAAKIAMAGHDVVGCDVDPRVVELVNAGKAPFPNEPGLEEALAGGAVRAQTDTTAAVAEGPDLVVLVPPLMVDADGRPDWRVLDAVLADVAAGLQPGTLVSLETTVPVGTTRGRVARALGSEHVVFSPERVSSGRVFRDLDTYPKLVGGLNAEAEARGTELYGAFLPAEIRAMGSAEAAELTKLAETTYRDVNIAFANELSLIAEKMGVDVWEVIGLANRHPRVNILSPGPGVGGHCIAVDPWFLVHSAPEQTPLIRTARTVNDGKTGYAIGRAEALIESLPGAPVGCLGLAFKANIDDFRESPALKVAASLAETFGSRIRIVEPYAQTLPKAFDGTGATLIDIDTALETCPILIVLVDHDVFKSVPLDERADKHVYDTRGIWPDQPRLPNVEPLRKVG